MNLRTLDLSDETQADVIDGMLATGWTLPAATTYVDTLTGASKCKWQRAADEKRYPRNLLKCSCDICMRAAERFA